MDIRHLHVSRTPDEAEAYILHGKRNRAEYLTRWSLISILRGKIIICYICAVSIALILKSWGA